MGEVITGQHVSVPVDMLSSRGHYLYIFFRTGYVQTDSACFLHLVLNVSSVSPMSSISCDSFAF